MERIESYLRDVLKRPVPSRDDQEGWRRLLLDTDLIITATKRDYASVAGLLLFGKNPNRRLPQAGVTAAAFPGAEKDYNTVDEERVQGPLTPIVSK